MSVDLVTLTDVQDWLDLPAGKTGRDALLQTLIRRVSVSIMSYLSRDFLLPRTVTEVQDGRGGQKITLKNWPIISISSLIVDGVSILPAPDSLSSGYVLNSGDANPPGNMQTIYLRGYRFTRGSQNISVTYTAGYQITSEADTVAATSPYVVNVKAPYGPWGSDGGVVQASDGSALTYTSASPTSKGQYTYDASGKYTFSAADGGGSVLITYGFVPADLYSSALEWIAEIWSRRDRVGVSSKSIGGGPESVTYTRSEIPNFIALSLRNYARVYT